MVSISPETVRCLLDYNPDTGLLVWRQRSVDWFRDTPRRSAISAMRAWNTKLAGRIAFTSIDTHGYHHGTILGVKVLAHRVCWVHYYGEWPAAQIDHENHIRTDNRISNLRDVENQSNARNQSLRSDNKSGVVGVYWSAPHGKWRAHLRNGTGGNYLGLFTDLDDAIAARRTAEVGLGFHPNHGKENTR